MSVKDEAVVTDFWKEVRELLRKEARALRKHAKRVSQDASVATETAGTMEALADTLPGFDRHLLEKAISKAKCLSYGGPWPRREWCAVVDGANGIANLLRFLEWFYARRHHYADRGKEMRQFYLGTQQDAEEAAISL